MQPLVVLTVKRDGGTQDVIGFWTPHELPAALAKAYDFLDTAYRSKSKRAIARIEIYNPPPPNPPGPPKP